MTNKPSTPTTESDARRIEEAAKNNPKSDTAKDKFDDRAKVAAAKNQTQK